MKLYAPKYYQDFVCIADKCKHSCCIGWEIDIDKQTLEIYSNLTNNYGEIIKQSIDYSDTPYFKLCPNGNCPHLNEKGLCNIILEIGEDYLCEICREHPRFYNDVPAGKEVGLGISCEEACRIILSSDNYNEIVELGEIQDESYGFEYDSTVERQHIFKILSDKKLTFNKKLENIKNKYGVSTTVNSDENWRELINSLEYLDDNHKSLFLNYTSSPTLTEKNEILSERLLAYLVYRHCTPADTYEDFVNALGFCLFFERLFASITPSRLTDPYEAARILSEELEYSEDNTQAIKLEFMF